MKRLTEEQKFHFISMELRDRYYIHGEIFQGNEINVIDETVCRYNCDPCLVKGVLNTMLDAEVVAGRIPQGSYYKGATQLSIRKGVRVEDIRDYLSQK